MQQKNVAGRRWYSGPIDFDRESQVSSNLMQLDCYSCNGGYYGDREWGDWSYNDVKEVRENQQLNIQWFKDDVDYTIEELEIELSVQRKTILLSREWGIRMANLFLRDYNAPNIASRHVVILPCPGNLYRFFQRNGRDSDPERILGHCYYNHIAFHIGLSFSTELARNLRCEIPVILPHGFLNPSYRKDSARGKPWSRANIGHAPSEAALEELRDADEIHLIDDNVVYGGTMARMAVGAFLACEEIRNLDARINMHSWYAQTKKPRRHGGSTPLHDIRVLAKRVNYVEHEKREIIDEGVFFVRPSGKVEPEFWKSDLLLEIPHIIKGRLIERRLEEEKKRKIEREKRENSVLQRAADEEANRLLPIELEKRLKLSIERQKNLLELRNELIRFKLKLENIERIFLTNYIENTKQDEYSKLLSNLYDFLDVMEQSPWNIEDGEWGKKFRLIEEVSKGSYYSGEERILLEPSKMFHQYVGYWERKDSNPYPRISAVLGENYMRHYFGNRVVNWERDVPKLLPRIKELYDGVVSAQEENKRLHHSKRDTLMRIEEICESCELQLKNLSQIYYGVRMHEPSEVSIGEIIESVSIMQTRVKEISWNVELLWDTEEKVNRGRILEDKRDELIGRFGRISEVIPRFSKLEEAIKTRLNDSFASTNEIADFKNFWDSPRTEIDIDDRLDKANHLLDFELPSIEKSLSSLQGLADSTPDLFPQTKREGPISMMERMVEEFREISQEYR